MLATECTDYLRSELSVSPYHALRRSKQVFARFYESEVLQSVFKIKYITLHSLPTSCSLTSTHSYTRKTSPHYPCYRWLTVSPNIHLLSNIEGFSRPRCYPLPSEASEALSATHSIVKTQESVRRRDLPEHVGQNLYTTLYPCSSNPHDNVRQFFRFNGRGRHLMVPIQ